MDFVSGQLDLFILVIATCFVEQIKETNILHLINFGGFSFFVRNILVIFMIVVVLEVCHCD